MAIGRAVSGDASDSDRDTLLATLDAEAAKETG